jgi:hypothetical protein
VSASLLDAYIKALSELEEFAFQRAIVQRLLVALSNFQTVSTYPQGDGGLYIYLENLAPLFYIEQEEGWTEIQARQIGRYGQQQIRELSVEYLLGAVDTVDQRVLRQRAATLDSTLRSSARSLAERASQIFLKQGWAIDFSGNGSLKEIEARWSSQTIKEILKRQADVDIAEQRAMAIDHVSGLRRILTKEPVDPANVSAPSSASQLVVDLKQHRHKLNSELRTLKGNWRMPSIYLKA